MTELRIRVTKGADGKANKYEFMRNGVKLDDISKAEIIDAAMQFISSLRDY